MEQKLSDQLRMTRMSCNLTQQQVADRLEIDRSTYTYYETGKTTPSIFTLMKLAEIFQVPIDSILSIK
jgi:DNA-binding XRE family transcriptional regulator